MADSNAKFIIKADGIDKVTQAFKKVSKVARPDHITKVISEELLVIHNEYFEKRESPDGIKWQDKSQATKKEYARQGITNSKILEKHQYLKYLTVGSNHKESWIGSDRDYAEYNQFGTKNKDGSIRAVARPFLGLNDHGKNHIETSILDMIQTALK